MNDIKGNKIKKIKKFIFFEDLIYFDGPILYHSKDKEKNNYLHYWVDSEKDVYRWLIFKVSELRLWEFLNKNISLRDLIENAEGSLTLLEAQGSKTLEAISLENAMLPKEYLPNKNFFYALSIPQGYDYLKMKFAKDNEEKINSEKICYVYSVEKYSSLDLANFVTAIQKEGTLLKLCSQ